MIDSIEALSIEPAAIDENENDVIINNDIITGSSDASETLAAEGGTHKGIEMDLVTLKAEHPALYAQAVAVGADQGVKTERQRVEAHATMGEASGDMELALKCIKDGSEHTAATNALYMAAQMNKASTDNRDDESEGDLDTDATDGDVDSNDEAVAKALAEHYGVEI